nr:MAG TPA: hypothetical protein [Caudoviricetes sp.]
MALPLARSEIALILRPQSGSSTFIGIFTCFVRCLMRKAISCVSYIKRLPRFC